MADLCDQCRQDEVYAECGHCNDGRGYCGECLLDHDCQSVVEEGEK